MSTTARAVRLPCAYMRDRPAVEMDGPSRRCNASNCALASSKFFAGFGAMRSALDKIDQRLAHATVHERRPQRFDDIVRKRQSAQTVQNDTAAKMGRPSRRELFGRAIAHGGFVRVDNDLHVLGFRRFAFCPS